MSEGKERIILFIILLSSLYYFIILYVKKKNWVVSFSKKKKNWVVKWIGKIDKVVFKDTKYVFFFFFCVHPQLLMLLN